MFVRNYNQPISLEDSVIKLPKYLQETLFRS